MNSAASEMTASLTPPPAGGSLVYRPASIVERIPLEQLFPSSQPLEVELGSGDGSFLIQYAKAHPEHNFIGVERLLGRLRKIDRKGMRAGLANLRAVRLEAAYFLEYLLPFNSVQRLHIYFPDPWPKRRHHKNRLINTTFPGIVHRILAPGGEVFLRTDEPSYYAQMLEVFAAAEASFEKIETPEELSAVITDFEREFHARGIPTLRTAYRKR